MQQSASILYLLRSPVPVDHATLAGLLTQLPVDVSNSSITWKAQLAYLTSVLGYRCIGYIPPDPNPASARTGTPGIGVIHDLDDNPLPYESCRPTDVVMQETFPGQGAMLIQKERALRLADQERKQTEILANLQVIAGTTGAVPTLIEV